MKKKKTARKSEKTVDEEKETKVKLLKNRKYIDRQTAKKYNANNPRVRRRNKGRGTEVGTASKQTNIMEKDETVTRRGQKQQQIRKRKTQGSNVKGENGRRKKYKITS